MYIDQEGEADKTGVAGAGDTGMGGAPTNPDAPVVVSRKRPPWDAIKFLISEVTYGGRVTDDWDRRLLNVYANEFFNQKVLDEEKHKLADPALILYSIPEELTGKELKNLDKFDHNEAKYYASKVGEFPPIEKPEVFGQHINAEISSQIISSNSLIDSIMSLSP